MLSLGELIREQPKQLQESDLLSLVKLLQEKLLDLGYSKHEARRKVTVGELHQLIKSTCESSMSEEDLAEHVKLKDAIFYSASHAQQPSITTIVSVDRKAAPGTIRVHLPCLKTNGHLLPQLIEAAAESPHVRQLLLPTPSQKDKAQYYRSLGFSDYANDATPTLKILVFNDTTVQDAQSANRQRPEYAIYLKRKQVGDRYYKSIQDAEAAVAEAENVIIRLYQSSQPRRFRFGLNSQRSSQPSSQKQKAAYDHLIEQRQKLSRLRAKRSQELVSAGLMSNSPTRV